MTITSMVRQTRINRFWIKVRVFHHLLNGVSSSYDRESFIV